MVVDSPGGMDLARIEDYPSLYTGSIAAILPDGAKVDADCPLKTLRTLRGYSKVHAGKPTHGGLPLQTTNMAAEQEGNPQQVVLLYNGQKWRVTDVVK